MVADCINHEVPNLPNIFRVEPRQHIPLIGFSSADVVVRTRDESVVIQKCIAKISTTVRLVVANQKQGLKSISNSAGEKILSLVAVLTPSHDSQRHHCVAGSKPRGHTSPLFLD